MMASRRASSGEIDRQVAFDALRALGWLSTCPSDFQSALLGNARPLTFAASETIYAYGDEPKGLYGLVEGNLQIEVPGDHGESTLIHQASPGFWVGDLALFSNTHRLISLTARAETHMLFIPSDRLRRMVRETPGWLEHLYRLTHMNMETALRLIANLAVANSQTRVALRLMHLSETYAEQDGWLHLSQEQLATLTAVSIPTIHRVLRKLSDLGLIELGYGKLRLPDRGALTQFVTR